MSGHTPFRELQRKRIDPQRAEQLRRETEAAIAAAAKERCRECGSHDLIDEIRCGHAPDEATVDLLGAFTVCRTCGAEWRREAGQPIADI